MCVCHLWLSLGPWLDITKYVWHHHPALVICINYVWPLSTYFIANVQCSSLTGIWACWITLQQSLSNERNVATCFYGTLSRIGGLWLDPDRCLPWTLRYDWTFITNFSCIHCAILPLDVHASFLWTVWVFNFKLLFQNADCLMAFIMLSCVVFFPGEGAYK